MIRLVLAPLLAALLLLAPPSAWAAELQVSEVTLEPCPMCAGALVQARVGRVVFGAPDPKRGGLGGVLDLSKDPSAHHHMQVHGGMEAEACAAQLEGWFKQRRLQQRQKRSGRPAVPAQSG